MARAKLRKWKGRKTTEVALFFQLRAEAISFEISALCCF
jgi:hypothetical protein